VYLLTKPAVVNDRAGLSFFFHFSVFSFIYTCTLLSQTIFVYTDVSQPNIHNHRHHE